MIKRLLTHRPAWLALCLFLGAPLRAADAAPLPETCYLFAYFYHDREGEGFRLAWSADGYDFKMLNGGQSYLKPTAGEHKLMRGYLPHPVYSAHYIRDARLRRPVADYLERERVAVVEQMELMEAEASPFKKGE